MRSTSSGRERLAGLGAALAVALAGAAVSSCGVPTDHSPRAIARGDLPAVLAGTSTTLNAGPETVRLHIYLVRNAGSNATMKGVWVTVRNESSTTSQATAVLQRLIADAPPSSGPTAGLTNAIPPTLKILDADLHGNVLDLDLSPLSVENAQQRLAFAEMVYTATDLTGIDAVRFSVSGQAAQVPLDTSISGAGAAITRASYRQLGPGT